MGTSRCEGLVRIRERVVFRLSSSVDHPGESLDAASYLSSSSGRLHSAGRLSDDVWYFCVSKAPVASLEWLTVDASTESSEEEDVLPSRNSSGAVLLASIKVSSVEAVDGENVKLPESDGEITGVFVNLAMDEQEQKRLESVSFYVEDEDSGLALLIETESQTQRDQWVTFLGELLPKEAEETFNEQESDDKQETGEDVVEELESLHLPASRSSISMRSLLHQGKSENLIEDGDPFGLLSLTTSALSSMTPMDEQESVIKTSNAAPGMFAMDHFELAEGNGEGDIEDMGDGETSFLQWGFVNLPDASPSVRAFYLFFLAATARRSVHLAVKATWECIAAHWDAMAGGFYTRGNGIVVMLFFVTNVNFGEPRSVLPQLLAYAASQRESPFFEWLLARSKEETVVSSRNVQKQLRVGDGFLDPFPSDYYEEAQLMILERRRSGTQHLVEAKQRMWNKPAQHIFSDEVRLVRFLVDLCKDCGLLEVITDAQSLDGLKKKGNKISGVGTSLPIIFERACGRDPITGEHDPVRLERARANFISSMAAYSLFSYIFLVKDRHNGNIMLDTEGHVVHIDFGFVLGIAPGNTFSLETAPFKLTPEMVEIMGGEGFDHYRQLVAQGLLALHLEAQQLLSLVYLSSKDSCFPCFKDRSRARIVRRLSRRLCIGWTVQDVERTAARIVDKSNGHRGTRQYDWFQKISNGILP
ncbi:hypothetical protein JG687_00007174 [Phytophthora cactorum]|uniref:PI3K/PI4K catalytic domain-containing protein n=1 Tax=Phytophthora cactorum TaxID=29920 RepID=A0A8T1UL29_9STRA|nr:hypothetical protein JG687_00007174 [Phytophthora cactorum]